MSRQHKYLVTTNAETGEIESVEQIGSAGELIRVDPSAVLGASVGQPQSVEPVTGAAEPGVFVSPELPDVETAAPGVFFGGAELPDVGVFYSSAELPEVRTEEVAPPGVFFHSPELPEVAPQ